MKASRATSSATKRPTARADSPIVIDQTTRHSEWMPGNPGNYGWPVQFDVTVPDGYLGVNQRKDDGRWDRVLLSPGQVRALWRFLRPAKRRRRGRAA